MPLAPPLRSALVFLASLVVANVAWAGIGISDLSITKTDGATVSVIGGSITYTIVGTNNGPDDVFSATVTDTFPSELSCTWTCSASSGASCAASGTGDISDTVSLLETETVTYTVICSISGSAVPGASLDNTASISSPATDPDSANDTATDSNLLIPTADISITKTDGVTTAAPGGALTYTIVASNAGPMDTFATSVVDTFPSDLTCTWTCSASVGSSCSAAGAGDINDPVSLLAGGTATYTAVCDIALTATGTLSNTATISGSVFDPTPGDQSATDADTVLSPRTDLSITKADSVDPATAGEDLTYTLTVTNAGPSTSTGSTVTDVLPSGVTFSTSSDCTEAGGTVTCAVGTLAPGANDSVTFTVTVDPDQTAALSNTATVAANETDPASGTNSATEGTSVGAETDLSIAKADSVDPAMAGEALTYTLTVTNAGPSTSTGSTVTDVLPSGLTFSTSSDCTEAAGTVTCAVGTLAPGANDSVAFTVTVDPGQTAALSNTATVAANETDPASGNNSATEGTSVGAETDLSIAKADSVDPATAGGALTYTLTVTNAGPSTSTGSTVTDVLPSGLTFST
ncbi:MAG: CARDB domain-containing protein, partial [Acidobacteriota bacterium]